VLLLLWGLHTCTCVLRVAWMCACCSWVTRPPVAVPLQLLEVLQCVDICTAMSVALCAAA
jgi:hypothetical protein